MPYRCIICKVPEPLFKGIEKLQKDTEQQMEGFQIPKNHISVALGNQILDDKIKLEIMTKKKNNRNMICLGGFINVPLKKR